MRDRFLVFLASYLGPILIYLLGKTLRIEWVGEENLDRIRRENKSVIYAFWHGRMLIFTYSHRKRKIHVLISQHRDGEYIARIIHRLGFVSLRGSTTRGGSKALFEMCDRTVAGFDVAVTPDGPKGPGFKVHPGIIYVAQRSGMPIVPITNSARNRWDLYSWDRFLIPKPFSKTVIMLGEPICVPPESAPEQLEEKRRELEQRMSELTEKADDYFSHSGQSRTGT
ncbi:MAG: lysophospholipid acyltransferase family protein [Candidatus Zixiibacteriota bacterium]|nr:MAG: lysophospholipid acyltransferase family protein [candidate division Zixibacteria bacterium]